jgi:Glycosyltransferases involved in cell wall biogenesis
VIQIDTLYIVVPCYNEEEVLPETSKRLREKLRALVAGGKISSLSKIMLVNDGSKDRTWELISHLNAADSVFSGVCLSRNRGHQNALLAGLMTARRYADMVISMDADLQDDMDAVDKMVEKYYEGCDIVYGVRSSREKDSFFKRFTAEGFYKITNSLGGEVVFNHADYRLMSRRALDALSEYSEVNLFLRGIVPMLGYKTDIVEYERGERFAGESKYPLKKMLSFAGDGITSLSSKPIKFISFAGILSITTAFVLLVIFITGSFFGQTLWGWRILLFTIVLFGGLILLSIGIVGEYVGKSYIETKHRPRYFISEIIHD